MALRAELEEKKDSPAEETPKNPHVFFDSISAEDVVKHAVTPCHHVFDAENPVSITGLIQHSEKTGKQLCCPECRKEFKKEGVLPLVPAWERLRNAARNAEELAAAQQAELKRQMEHIHKFQRQYERDHHTKQVQAAQIESLEAALAIAKTENLELSDQLKLEKTKVFDLNHELKKLDQLDIQKTNLVRAALDKIKFRDETILEMKAKIAEKNQKLNELLPFQGPGSTAEKLRAIFEAEKVIQRSLEEATLLGEKVEPYLQKNIEAIRRIKHQIELAKKGKQELEERHNIEMSSLVANIAKAPDAKEITDKITTSHQQYLIKTKTQDGLISTLENEMVKAKIKYTKTLSVIATVEMRRRFFVKKASVAKQKQLLEISKLTDDKTQLKHSSFFQRHKPSFDRWVANSKKTIAEKKSAQGNVERKEQAVVLGKR